MITSEAHGAIVPGGPGDATTIQPPPVGGTAPPDLDGRRLLVVRADRLGDVILSLPVLGTLRARFPAARLALLTSPAVAPLLAGHPWIDCLLVDDRHGRHAGWGGWRRLVGEVRAGGFDLALVLRPTPRHALLPWAARIPLRAGTAFRAYSWFFNRRVRLHRRGAGRHELVLNLAMLAAVIGPVDPLAPRLTVSPAAAVEARRRLADAALDGPWIALHAGSGGSAREWPPAHFAALARELRTRGYRVMLTGSSAEAPLVGAIAGAAEGSALDLAGRTSLPVLAALLAESAAVVACSTGPLHLAAALGRPVVALYPPLVDAAPLRWGPWSRQAAVLEAEGPSCTRCTRERCPVWDCMATLSPAMVADQVERLLEPANGAASRPRARS